MKIPKEFEETDLMPNAEALQVVLDLYENIVDHPIRTAESFRNTAMGEGMFAISPLLDIKEKFQVDFLLGILRKTIREGRMIDFGFLPNKVIKETSWATREVYTAGELQHPYEDWLAVSAWEGGMCGYYFAPFLQPNRILAVELYGIAPPGKTPAVVINDIVSLESVGEDIRISPWPMIDRMRESSKDMQDRGGNLIDPLVTFLRLLSDASVPITDHPAPEKLNKRRIIQGKFPIPAHTRVETHNYVSLVQGHAPGHSPARGGHHASPIPHWRRAHQRHLQTGRVVPVRSSKVNWREQEELHRLFYRVPHAAS